jgi:proline dehydrogenase
LVLQAYLHRTLGDLQDLLVWDKNRGWLNIRICKGIYNESKEIAFKGRDEIRRNFLICLEYMLRNHIYAAVATHDKELISVAFRMAEAFSVPSHKIEFQMLYGVTPELRKSVMNKGFSMRVYVPYGKDWFNYSTRRLKENPVMALYILKALLVRG